MMMKILWQMAILFYAGSTLYAGSISGTVKCIGVRNCADAVVYVEAIEGKTFPPPSAPVHMDQEDMLFVPHVLPVLVGTTVEFKNSDSVLHNVFTPDKCAERFNLGSWPQGQSRSFTFKKPCAATILCNVHPEMEAFVVAVPTPYVGVANEQGAYVIDEVPDGGYTVKVWHPKLKETSREVTVSGEATMDFEIRK